MEDALLEIVAAIKAGDKKLDDDWLEALARRHNRKVASRNRAVAKRRLLPFYLDVREHDPDRWQSWDIDPQTEAALIRVLKMKPRRTASGVATITVITKPWPCSSDCLYCPNDVRMPKSYLANEPACQRAEHNYFDPYLQVKSRLYVLEQMGHVTDKVELIVLGGTWNDYPQEYQRWFVRELFRAVNDDTPYLGGPELPASTQVDDGVSGLTHSVATRTAFYAGCGILSDADQLAQAAESTQQLVNKGTLSYNEAARNLMASGPWDQASRMQRASWEEVEQEHRINEGSRRRVVGLVIETRPDLITVESARTMRRLGCTKIQMGIQSLDDTILRANHRMVSSAQIARAFAVLRTFGFKIHVHFMANLLGSTVVSDEADYRRLVSDKRFCPDEVKLYPCALVESSHLMTSYASGAWQPYTHEQLVDLLVNDVLATPAYVRISRMIRDISATDIVAGNKKTNLRQMVEMRLADRLGEVREIRMREVATHDVQLSDLHLDCVCYQTGTAEERFLQWVDGDGHIAGFCRLSLPSEKAIADELGEGASPLSAHTAMIREVHVYGRVAGLGTSEQCAAQHAGLGKALVETACEHAHDAGFSSVAVISAIGTRGYYRMLGFHDAGLYQIRDLQG
ncbi:MAG: tRNA uridine(34) 5-carboxymethylaminomethyl modification radical SAM/GNAT enzyme Elp3 [Atopobiaceae bacterium]|nr:tRNA uridine(34) 5-carboxymethylaminomethyl modification radical SAM/GNAT enzyme Elp3 [Atopobiaceae bacterium]